MEHIVEKINALKKEKNAVILAHCYQPVEIDLVADYVGDSLKLSQVAAETDADIIVFAGVFFMAQTAKLLSPNKKVLLPQIHAGCRMADMISYKQLKEFKAMHPDIPTVCYVNSTAEVKSECDMCCTSSNAVNIVKSMNEEKILFVPDTYLGKWVEKQLGNVEVITYPGFCPTHLQIRPKDIEEARKAHPNALVLAHPECHMSVSDMADYVGSTTGIMKFAKESSNKEFIIGTEISITDHLGFECPNKLFYSLSKDLICSNMKATNLTDVYHALLGTAGEEIILDDDTITKVKACIDKMIELG